MFVLVGASVVLISVVGGFMLGGGKPLVLLRLSEFVVIGGMVLGVFICATPTNVMKEILHKTKAALGGKTPGKDDFFDLLKLLYEVLMLGRRNGLIALEEHVMDPANSPIFKKYPSVLEHHERLSFICNGLKPIIDGKIKPDQLESLMSAEIEAKENEADHSVHTLQMIGDSLPGIGIVAAVLGIINTMSAIADGPDKVGERVAAALTGTFLGIFAAYGFVNPLASRIKFNNASDIQCLRCVKHAVASFAKGLAPQTAVEIARRSLDASVQPGADELEVAVKAIAAQK